jgi:hypothetical protein
MFHHDVSIHRHVLIFELPQLRYRALLCGGGHFLREFKDENIETYFIIRMMM